MEKEERNKILGKLYRIQDDFEEMKRQMHYAEIKVAVLINQIREDGKK